MFKPPTDTENFLNFFGNSILYYIFAVNQYFFIMRTRKVNVFIFEYPEDMNKTLSLRRLFEVSEELIFADSFLSDKLLVDLLSVYCEKAENYASLHEDNLVYRVIVRDSDNRLFKIFKA